jgi:putative transposase
LKAKIKQIFTGSYETYGYRRVHMESAPRQGVQVGDELVGQLMRQQDLVACQPRPYRPATTVQGDEAAIPDLVVRDFTAAAPGVKLVGDITYIPTWQGWVYPATVTDCYSKAVVGWSMSDSLHTDLVCAAIEAAADCIALQPDCVFHSDRGSQYTSAQLGACLAKHNLRGSVGRLGCVGTTR